MRRITTTVRPSWEKTVEEHGVTFHEGDEKPYWDESAYYEFSEPKIDRLEAATLELDGLCLKAVEAVISRGLWTQFQIASDMAPWVTRSWERRERSLYGRFDLWFDGRDIKLLEYNADTPTSLLEAASAQWFWVQDKFGEKGDQFNSLHEHLIEAWKALRRDTGPFLHVASIDDGEEDFMTANYLRDTAAQAGFQTHYLPVDKIAWHPGRRRFVDDHNQNIDLLFKLYPWEWLVREEFGNFLPKAPTRWIEPPWKMILSNKALLPLLWELFPEHPLLLRAAFEPWNDTYARKPIFAREGANVLLMENGRTRAQSSGLYSAPYIYQDFRPLPEFDGNYPVLGSWMIGGHAAGMGIREDSKLITSNQSRFVPHLLKTSE